MGLLGWILLPTNVIGYLWAWRWWIRTVKGEFWRREEFDGFNFAFLGIFVGFWIAIPWPLVLIGSRVHMICIAGNERGFWESVAMRLTTTRGERKAKAISR